MVSKDEILTYINTIPTSSKAIKEAIKALDANDMLKSAELLLQMPPIVAYMQKMSQMGIQTLQQKNPPINVVLSFFGYKKSKAILYSYLISLTLPKKWGLFCFDNEQFFLLNSQLLYYWELILKAKTPNDVNKFISATPLISASVSICDAIFSKYSSNIKALNELANIDLNDILHKITGMSIFDIAKIVGEKLGFEKDVVDIVYYADGRFDDIKDKTHLLLSKYLHLLLFFILSKPNYIKAGLNSFIRFKADKVSDIIDEFQSIIGGFEH